MFSSVGFAHNAVGYLLETGNTRPPLPAEPPLQHLESVTILPATARQTLLHAQQGAFQKIFARHCCHFKSFTYLCA